MQTLALLTKKSLCGITPLCLAAYLGKHEIARAMLSHGAKVDALDANGATPLMYAARDGHVQGRLVCHFLLS